jgi:thioredoxin reductase
MELTTPISPTLLQTPVGIGLVGSIGHHAASVDKISPGGDIVGQTIFVATPAICLRKSRDLILCTDGPSELSKQNQDRLAAHRITIREERIARLEGNNGVLERITFQGGDALRRRAMFFNTGQYQHSPLAKKLGCEITDAGGVKTGDYGQSTTTAGLYIVGDATRDVQFAIVAAAEAAEAACAINKALLKADNLL